MQEGEDGDGPRKKFMYIVPPGERSSPSSLLHRQSSLRGTDAPRTRPSDLANQVLARPCIVVVEHLDLAGDHVRLHGRSSSQSASETIAGLRSQPLAVGAEPELGVGEHGAGGVLDGSAQHGSGPSASRSPRLRSAQSTSPASSGPCRALSRRSCRRACPRSLYDGAPLPRRHPAPTLEPRALASSTGARNGCRTSSTPRGHGSECTACS